MSVPRPYTYLAPAELDAAATITPEDRMLAQRTAPAPLRHLLNADRPA